ncbi:DNA helicase [Tanacetum coccineum]
MGKMVIRKTYWNEYLSGIYDAINRGDSDGSDCGLRLILPQSFTCGPRYMYSHYLDALAICRVHGNPSFFITFTCNVKWPEIAEYVAQFPLLYRAHIVEILYTVEFQKRGLPHCHTLLWIHESAELPSEDVDPQCYNIVSEFIMHGPCGLACPSASWTDRVVARISRNRTDVSAPVRPLLLTDRRERDRLDSVILDTYKTKTTLTEWLDYSERNADGRHLTYLDFPSEFVWYTNGKYWQRRRVRTKSSIGRLSYGLKIGTPIMLLRNVNIVGGLYNGTRLIVTQLLPNVIEAQIITGTRVSQKVFLPCIMLTARNPRAPFVFKRKQFPIKHAMP